MKTCASRNRGAGKKQRLTSEKKLKERGVNLSACRLSGGGKTAKNRTGRVARVKKKGEAGERKPDRRLTAGGEAEGES